MSAEIQAACRESGQPVPCKTPNWRAVSDSLALLYADILQELAQLRGAAFSQLHIACGGCQNTLLEPVVRRCLRYAVSGPIEASTLGNIGIQLMTLDELNNVDDFRQVAR
jgi:rhamnulokinase